MSGITKLVPALVIGDNEHDVGPGVSRVDHTSETIEAEYDEQDTAGCHLP